MKLSYTLFSLLLVSFFLYTESFSLQSYIKRDSDEKAITTSENTTTKTTSENTTTTTSSPDAEAEKFIKSLNDTMKSETAPLPNITTEIKPEDTLNNSTDIKLETHPKNNSEAKMETHISNKTEPKIEMPQANTSDAKIESSNTAQVAPMSNSESDKTNQCNPECSSENCLPGCSFHCCLKDTKTNKIQALEMQNSQKVMSYFGFDNSNVEQTLIDTINQISNSPVNTNAQKLSEIPSYPQYYPFYYSNYPYNYQANSVPNRNYYSYTKKRSNIPNSNMYNKRAENTWNSPNYQPYAYKRSKIESGYPSNLNNAYNYFPNTNYGNQYRGAHGF